MAAHVVKWTVLQQKSATRQPSHGRAAIHEE
jgi:hypothetical protein